MMLDRQFFGPFRRFTAWLAVCVAICLVCLTAVPAPVVAGVGERFRVSFINPGRSNELFWVSVSEFMRAAANDLNIELTVHYAERDRVKMRADAIAAIEQDNPPQYLVLVNEFEAAKGLVKAANDKNIKVFLLNNTFTGEHAKQFGGPRSVLKNWIGDILPDHRSGGYAIGRILIKAAKAARPNASSNDPIRIVAINGDKTTQAAIERGQGLDKAAKESGHAIVLQTVYAHWRRDKAKDLASGLLKRYPDLDAIWTANDPMALGALDASVAAGRAPGKDIFIGGLNWAREAVESVVSGKLTVTVGGHFMQGGWVMVMLRDFHDGLDFRSETISPRLKFGVVDKTNAKTYLDKFGDGNWERIDFCRFSKSCQPGLKSYNFDATSLMRE